MNTTTVAQTMKADNDTLIITDPCYIMREEDWDKWTSSNDCFTNPNSLVEYLTNEHNFGEVIAADTGYGDWTNEITEVGTDNCLGEFAADAGMVIVCTASDLTNYGYDKERIEDLQEKGCLAIIPTYTGTVELVYEYNNKYNDRLAVIHGTSDTDFNFTTLGWSE